MSRLTVGLTGKMEMTVEPCHLASHRGHLGADVLSTHHLVLLLEQAARDAIQGRLPSGKITVGTMVRIRHVAATPLGARVRAWAYLRQVRGRKLVFDVGAYDEWDKISEGENVQLIVSLEKFLERTRQKHQHIGEKSQ